MKALVVIDMQNDFIDGALGTPEAQAIVPKVKNKIEEYRERGEKIIFTRDTHFKQHYMHSLEGKHLPIEHCMAGTRGWQIPSDLTSYEDERINKYSFGYDQWNLNWFRDDKHDIPEEIEIVGLCTDHKYNVYDHIAHAVAFNKGTDISIKMALLLHDIGKPLCYTEDEDGIGHFHGHGSISHKMATDILERLRFDNKTKGEVLTLVLYHDAVINPDNRTVKRWMNKIGPEMLNKLMFVRVADIYAQSEINLELRRDKALGVKLIMKDILAKQQCFTLKDLAINGHDVNDLGIESGPMIGMILNNLLDKVIDGEIENDFHVLMNEAQRYLER